MKLIVIDRLACQRSGWLLGEELGGYMHGRAREKFCGLDLMRQQLFDLSAQFSVVTTGLFQKGRTLCGSAFQCRIKEMADALIPFRSHAVSLN
jgi:hypothetical protein